VRAGERLNVNIPLTLVVGDGVTVEDYSPNDSSKIPSLSGDSLSF